ncbi:MAG: methionine ABC transporter ATP-binding protein [Helicobacteraceae bacterium]|jgi:D-methionine transport system ATP-binding protein|nr:methionine ABC transporter ATP-binding protein [Helicobacteraceae bacterium]
MIEIKGLFKSYTRSDGSKAEVLKNINLYAPDRSITAIVGPSGAGKSTLSKCISLLEKPTSGSILVNGKDLSRLSGERLREERRSIGIIFQSSALLSRKSAAQNIALPLEYLGVIKSDIDKRVKELLEAVGLPDRGGYYPAQLSGGQQQRIGIARALALHPQVLLSDEATAGLDPHSTETILSLLKKLRDEFDLSIIMITHEMEVVRNAADYIAAIQDGEIVEYGKASELVANPNSGIGRQLISLRVAEAFNKRHLVAELTYGANVPPNWLQILSDKLDVNIHLLGANIEQIGQGGIYGRALVGLEPLRSGTTDITAVNNALKNIGLHAEYKNQNRIAS